jgi:hypothetical protein
MTSYQCYALVQQSYKVCTILPDISKKRKCENKIVANEYKVTKLLILYKGGLFENVCR